MFLIVSFFSLFQMQGCPRISPQNVRNVDGCKGDIFYEAVAAKHSDVPFLDLSNMSKVTDKGLAALIRGCPNDCEGATDDGLAELVQNCPNLHPDKIYSQAKGESFLAAVVAQREDLERIDLQDCAVAEKSLARVLRKCLEM